MQKKIAYELNVYFLSIILYYMNSMLYLYTRQCKGGPGYTEHKDVTFLVHFCLMLTKQMEGKDARLLLQVATTHSLFVFLEKFVSHLSRKCPKRLTKFYCKLQMCFYNNCSICPSLPDGIVHCTVITSCIWIHHLGFQQECKFGQVVTVPAQDHFGLLYTQILRHHANGFVG